MNDFDIPYGILNNIENFRFGDNAGFLVNLESVYPNK